MKTKVHLPSVQGVPLCNGVALHESQLAKALDQVTCERCLLLVLAQTADAITVTVKGLATALAAQEGKKS